MLSAPITQTHRPRESSRAKPKPPAVNANLLDVLLLNSGGLVLVFDGPVTINVASPPTTWSFNGGTSIQEGWTVNFGQSSYILLNSPAGSGDPVIIAAGDPGARTPSGGYVNGAVMVVSDM